MTHKQIVAKGKFVLQLFHFLERLLRKGSAEWQKVKDEVLVKGRGRGEQGKKGRCGMKLMRR